MPIRNDRARWGTVSQLLHWLIALMVFAQIALALIFKQLRPGPELFALIGAHKSLGLAILVVVVIRLIWRWFNPVPDLPSTLKPYERFLARFTHGALYFLLIAMPVTGWLGSAALGFPIRWFNLFQVPNPIAKNVALGHALFFTHSILAFALGAVLILHIAAALRHHWVLKDDTLRRMLPGFVPKS
jgi:cytochrome b561